MWQWVTVGGPRRCLILVGAAVTVLCFASCGGGGALSRLGRVASPYERYAETLQRAGLGDTALWRDWVRAGEQALLTAVAAEPPFHETGYFAPDTPAAIGYRMTLRRGRRLAIDVSFESADPGLLFVDLFQLPADGSAPRHVASLAEGTLLSHDVDRDGAYIVRIQPELLRGGRYTVVERTLATLAFPVPSLTRRAVDSAFGTPRDAGAREHEGVDIFAPRDAPVVAVADGLARSATNALGGNVVWLHAAGGRRFYYAHLDRAAVQGSARVRAGDVLGFVGNTGNARRTLPHLHFGIYEGGAVDPLPWLQPDDPLPPAPQAPLEPLATLMRVLPARTQLRSGADRNSAPRRHLDARTVVRVMGVSQRSYRVQLPDGSIGYLDGNALTAAASAVGRQPLPSGSILRERPLDTAPVVEVTDRTLQAEVLGRFGAFALLRLPGERLVWFATGR
jgi:murein DD-endopeptidase MepM/ murein hydrolase activator NlpD